eukprot:2370125-Rhodomonas_salina.1
MSTVQICAQSALRNLKTRLNAGQADVMTSSKLPKKDAHDSAPLREGWQQKVSASTGKVYYVHVSGKSQWHKPVQ